MKPDFVAEFVALARQTMPDAPPDALRRLETGIRDQWGGRQVRIEPVPVPAGPTIDEVDARLRQRMPVRAIAQELGVHRSTIYRMLDPRRAKVARQARRETAARA